MISRYGQNFVRGFISVAIIAAAGANGCDAQATNRYVNPAGLVAPTGYTHVVVAADGRTVYIAGQVALDSTGAMVGEGDFRMQTEKVFSNLEAALASVGGGFADLVKTTTFITDLSQVAVLREIRGRYLDPNHLPANSMIPVPTLARAGLVIEIEAIAVLATPIR